MAEGSGKSWMQFIPTIWEKMTPKEKEKYEKLAEEDTKRFQKEMEAYNEKFKNQSRT